MINSAFCIGIICTVIVAYFIYVFAYSYTESFGSQNRYALFYAYYEKNEEYKNNLRHFLTQGGLRDDIDYFFIINGTCSVDIPIASNITVISRENKGYDFGAWGNALAQIPLEYDYYIFINNSVIGPYLPDGQTDWLSPFMELFNDGPDIKIVGTSINIHMAYGQSLYTNTTPPYPHVQSMFFILDKDTVLFLLNNTDVFNEDSLNGTQNIQTVVLQCEIKMSNAILKNNWNINCILPKYRGIDYLNIKEDINTTSVNGDPYFPNAYFGETIQPTDVIFYKSYRIN